MELAFALKASIVIVGVFGAVHAQHKFYNVKEDASNGTMIHTFKCIQASNSTPELSFQGNNSVLNNHWFEVRQNTSNTWDLLAGRSFSSTPGSGLALNFKCHGPGAAIPFRVIIDEVNKHPPHFCPGSPVILNIPENQAVSKPIHRFSICDNDRRVVFSKPSVQPDSYFEVIQDGSAVLKLQLKQQYNYDTMPTHILDCTITIQDSTTLSSTTSTDFTFRVNITDVDDQSPAFQQPLYNCYITEGSYSSQNVCKVIAEDQDRGLNIPVHYTIISVVPSTNIFTIDSTGKIQASGSLDRESISSYAVVIKGFQQDRPNDRYNHTTVVINVTDLDDSPPVMSSTVYSKAIMENTQNGVTVLQVAATDPDLGDNGKFTFAMRTDPRKAFSINSTTGVIAVKDSTVLDYEDHRARVFTLLVHAVPVNHGHNVSEWSTVTFSLIDENDNAPTFQGLPYYFNISKNTSISSEIKQITAKDPDTGTSLSYHLVSQTETVPFSINSQTGALTVSGNLAVNYKPVYNLTVMAEDGPHSLATTRRSTARITLHVKDVNMFDPKFDKGIDGLVLNISEATSVGTYILELSASDKDLLDILNYTITGGNSENRFGLSEDQRRLYVKQNLDRETTPEYHLTVQVTDGSRTDTATINIKVMDENDCDPLFGQLRYNFTIREEQKGGTAVGTVNATDRDAGLNSEILYRLEDTLWSDNFTIDANTGVITTNGKIDRETGPVPVDVIELVVIATDKGSPPRTNTTRVTITVQDINDNKPTFYRSTVDITLSEGHGPGFVYQAQAHDLDGRLNNSVIHYKKVSGTGWLADYIHVAENGTITNSKPLEIDQNDHSAIIWIILEAYNYVPYSSTLSKRNNRVRIQLTLKDVNNNQPVFQDHRIDIQLEENYPSGKNFSSVTATDADVTAEFNTITYWLDSTDDNFGIDSATGELFLTKHLDYENKTSHSFTVFASDMHTASDGNAIKNASIPVTVRVLDVNDCTPEFINGPYNCSVSENYSGRLKDCKVQAKDGDGTRPNNQTQLMIYNSKLFTISTSGDINLTESLDYENSSIPYTFILQVVANDMGSPTQSAVTTVTVHLLNENDNVPRFDRSAYHFDVPENNSSPRLLKVIEARDDDGDELTYSCDNKDFTFTDGLLKVNTTLDYERASSVNFTIAVNDGRNTTTAKVYIKVVPVNEFPPVIHLNNKDINVTENTNVTFQFSVTDGDHGKDGKISVEARLTDQWKSHVVCNKDLIGSLATCSILDLDREITEFVEVLLVASDHGSPPRTAAVSKTVKVTGVNDNAPYFQEHRQSVTVIERTAKNNLYTAHAEDDDVGIGSVIRYRLKSPHSSLFNISADGRVSNRALNIDNTNKCRYTLEIEAYNDKSYQNCSQCSDGKETLIVKIQDVNDHVPHFLNHSVTKTIPEDTPLGTVITRVVARDDDFTEEFNTVSYTIQPQNDHFHIDTSSGLIYLTNNLDYENITQRIFIFKVYASDMKPNVLTKKIEYSNLTVTVTVSDVNDNSPVFIKGPYNCSVLEEYKGEVENCSVRAEDKDSRANGDVTYTVTNNQQLFTINGNGQLSLKKSLNYDKAGSQHVYRIQVKASDRGRPSQTALTTVTIHLLNKNDNPPVFNKSSYNFSIRENNTIGQLLQSDMIFATDADDDPLSYTISNPNFTLVDGFLRANVVLDYEVQKNITIVINVTDGVFMDSRTATVNILPVNEFSPRLIMKTHGKTGFVRLENNTVDVTEGSRASICVDTEDLDVGLEGEMNYTYSPPKKWSNFFSWRESQDRDCKLICRISGTIDRDIDDVDMIPVQFTIQDHGTPPRYGRTTLFVKVHRINDNSPWFPEPTKTFTVFEGVPQRVLYIAKASDDDKGIGSTVLYRLKHGNNSLFTVSQNGTVSTQALWIDKRNKGAFNFSVEAYNSEPLVNCTPPDPCVPGTQKVVIQLQDANNHAPQFTTAPAHINLNECLPTGSNLTRMVATDDDTTLAYNTVRYWLKDNYNSTFRIDTNTGDIYLEKSVNYDLPDNQTSFDLQIYNTDLKSRDVKNNHTALAKLQITVEDCNDNSPKFDTGPYNCSVFENSQLKDCTVLAKDGDKTKANNQIHYMINDSKIFNVSDTGQITSAGSLNYENTSIPHTFMLQVVAKDNGKPSLSATTSVTIHLLNKNDNPPVFNKSSYNFSIRENNTIGQLLQSDRIFATDADGDPLIYTVNDPNFRLNNGFLQATSVLDYETQIVHIFNVTVFDGLTHVNAPVTVHVMPVNEFIPQVNLRENPVDVIEGTKRKNICLNGKDLDDGPDGKMNATIGIPETWKSFISCRTNPICMLSICNVNNIDRDIAETGLIELSIKVQDHGTPPLSSTTVLIVNVKGVNDNSPVFVHQSKTYSIKEGETKGNFHIAMATDADKGVGSSVHYRLKDGNSSLFHVVDNGTVSTEPLWIDKTNHGVYSFIIEAFNAEPFEICKPNPCRNGTQNVTIMLQDVNNYTPVFDKPLYDVTLSECKRRGSNIIRVTARDKDASRKYNTVSYRLGDSYNKTFRIHSHTGDIYLEKLIDYDPPNNQINFNLLVYASDIDNQTANATVRITVENCNDNSPKFVQVTYRCTAKENATGPLNCTHPVIATDVKDGSDISYSIMTGLHMPFEIDSKSGVISVRQKLDYETSKHQFTVTVTATDHGLPPLKSNCTVIVQLENINDWSPEFLNGPYSFSVPENALPNTASIGDIAVRDRDGDHVTVMIQGHNSGFRLSDKLELFPMKSFNYEDPTERTFNLTLQANDSLHLTTARVTVHVLDRNDEAPKFLNRSYSVSVLENVNISHSVIQVTATDGDSAVNGNNLISYSILEGDAGTFSIDSTSGWITTVKKLNASVTETYTIVVQATDNGKPPLVSVTTVRVDVDDTNDLSPWFLYTPYSGTVRENEIAVVTKVYGKDPDPSTKNLSFDVVDKNMQKFFYFDNNTLYATNLDTETLGLHLEVKIRLSDDDSLHKVYETVHVTVIDVNDLDPYFNNTPYDTSVLDTAAAGVDVLTITAGDRDITNNNVTYMLYGGQGDFIIDRKTGVINVSEHADLNYGKKSKYNMTVLVQDSGSPPRTKSAVVTVHLTETNAGPPIFTGAPYTFTFQENNMSVSNRVIADDTDGVEYSIVSRNDNNKFSLDKATGSITLAHGWLDFENRSDYSLVIEATDKAAFNKSSTARVNIKVKDINEAPEIKINPKNVFKEINSTKGAEVMQIDGNDPDTNPKFNNLTYSLKEDGTDYFTIDRVSGKLTVKQRLDKAGNFSLNVTVSDGEFLDSGLAFVIVSNITGSSFNTTVYENKTAGSLVYSLKEAKQAVNLTGLFFEIQKHPESDNFKLKDNTTVVTATVLDRETAPVFGYDLIINGKDTVNKIMKAQIQLHVTVLDVNDNPPNFQKPQYNFSIKEEVNVGTTVDKVTATDIDLNPQLTYSIMNGSKYFDISNGTGTITVKETIDRESLEVSWNDVIHLQVACSDGNSSATTVVSINIIDVNDNSPEFTKKHYAVTLPENHRLDILPEPNITATDMDTVNQGKLNFSIINGNIGDHFSIKLKSGHLSLEKALDYENRTHFNLTIMVEDGIFNDTSMVYVQVVDVNDNSPEFQHPPYSFYTPEGPSSLGQIFNVTASDIDSGNNSLLSYSFSDDDAKRIGSYFKIYTNDNQGIIEVTSDLDRDSSLLPHENLTGNAFYTFTVIARDHGDPRREGTAKVMVYVTDINDCPPTFTETNITRDVQESSLPGYHIETVTTTDCDFYPNYTTVSYQLHGNGSDHFNISMAGDIILSKPVNLQERAIFDLVVVAFDGKNKDTAYLRINVIDTNDHTPDFGNSSFSFDVSEASAPGIVGNVLATDNDFGENGRVTYKISSGDGMDVFDIDTNGTIGIIRLTGHLDREKKDSYTLFITATDHAQKDKTRSGNCEVKITILDENDNSPIFHPSEIYSATIREDAGNGTLLHVIPKINATDIDVGDNGTAGIRYSLTGDGSQYFCIDPLTAVIKLCQGPLNRETEPNYQLQVIAIDRKGSSTGRNTTASLNITVMDVNDNIPQFIRSYEFSIPEDTNTTTSVGQVSVTDDDLPSSNKIRYAIRSGGMGQFYMDPVTGSIHVSGALDREHQDMYFLNVTVTDGREDHVSWTIVNITIQDVNDCQPQFDQTVLDVDVYEEQGPMVIGTDKAHDDDKANTENSRISFYLKNDPETDSLFSMSTNGTLSTLQTLDRENKLSYTLTVIAKDHGNPPLSNNHTIRVTVLDINDNYPMFCDGENGCSAEIKEKHTSIVEESPQDSVVALLVAEDADSGNNGTVEYSIEGDTRATQFFHINRNTGIVKLAQSVNLNRLVELRLLAKNGTENASLEVKVVATDQGTPNQKSTPLKLIVSVMGINDQAPQFKLPMFSFNISEDFKVGDIIGETGAIVNSSSLHLYYAKVSRIGNENFNITGQSGEIRLAASLDRERESYYTFPILVRDGGIPERTAYAAVEIHVLDYNDNHPVFQEDSYIFDIPENTTWTGVMNISAMDRDEGLNAALVFSLQDDFGGLLSIDNSSGLVSVHHTLDREVNKTISYTVLVKDRGTPSLGSNMSVTIQLLDVNDNAPTFYNSPNIVRMTENNISECYDMSRIMRKPTFCICENKDADQLRGNCEADQRLCFRYTDSTIPLQLNPKFQASSHLLWMYSPVCVGPGQKPRRPVFSQPGSIHVSVSVNQSFQVHAIDPDAGLNGTVIFGLDDQDSGPFQINPFTGRVILLEPLDYELVSEYNLTILASDQGQPSRVTTHRVIVKVIDEYDFVPKCNPEVTEMTIKSSVPVSTEVANVHAGKGNLTYTLTGGPPDLFSVDKLTGKITTDRYLGKQTKLYELSVTATDQISHKTDTCKVIVHIEDSSSSFPMPFYNVSIVENMNMTLKPYLLIDLNTTEELSSGHVSYTITGTDPKVTSKFWVDQASGRVFCNASLDREETGSYELYITAHSVARRKKRETDSTELGTVKLIVVVQDVNDSPPRFTHAQRQNQIFGVPSTAKANYLVTTLKTFDADDEMNSRTLYRVIDGDMTTFGVDQETGELKTLAAVAKSRKKQFKLTVMALDQDEPTLNDTILLKIYAVDPGEQLMLTANMSITDFTKKSEHLISKMGDILGVKVQLEYSTPHKQSDGSVDLKRTDIFFHGFNKTTNNIIPYDKMLDLMRRNEAKLKELFNMQLLEVDRVPVDHYLDPSQITVSQIALICMAVLIFFGSLLGIVLTIYSWQRFEETEESDRKGRENIYSQIELESLRSRHSNRPDVSAAFVNQGYTETVIGTGHSSLTKKKKGVQYESQELRMTFQEEMRGGIDLHNGPVHRDNGSYSMADSGVENLSQHSSDHNRPGSSSEQSDNRGDNHDKNTTGVAMVMDEERTGNSKHGVIKPRETDADNISRVSKVPVSTLEAPALKFLNVEEAPMMTSTPYQSHTDISTNGATEVILDKEHNRSDTESTTDILDVNKTIPGAESHDYENVDMQDVRKEGNETGMAEKEETTHEIIIESKDMSDERIDHEAVKEYQADPGSQSRGITLEEGDDDDVLYRDRTLTLSFEEIGETNDEDESTQF